MILNIQVLIDETDSRCEQILDDVETAHAENEGITIRTGGGSFSAEVLSVEEEPA